MRSLLRLKIIVEKHSDTYETAVDDVKVAIKFHPETFGPQDLEIDPPVLEAFVAETGVAV